MKKSKLILALLMAGMMSASVAGLAACNGDTSSTESNPANESVESVSTPEPPDSVSSDPTSEAETSEPASESAEPTDSGSEEPPVVEPDETAPVIAIEGNPTTLNVALGQPLTIPAATATDDVDGEVEVITFSETPGALVDGVFTSNILGRHLLTYYACDEAENETYVDVEINVTSDTVFETFDVDGYYDISALANDGGVFKENFQNGLNSPLIERAMQGEAELMASEDTVSGNSLVLDYSECVGKENRIFLTNLLPYLRSGEWTVTFDVKLVSGVGFSDFYFGYVKDGTVTSKDQNYSLAGMQVGETKTIEWKQLLDLDADAQYFFHMFRYAQEYSDPCVLAFDNFTFEYKEKIYNTVVPTFEQIQEGFTYDWSNNYMAITGGAPEKISEIENAEAKAAIEGASEGFGDTVMHLTGSGAHDLSALTKANDSDFFQAGWVYTFEIWYYCVSAGSTYMIAYDGTPSNNAFKLNPFTTGLKKVEIEYTVGGNAYALTFYGSMDVYLGNMKITCAEPSIVREDYYAVTHEDMLKEGGYTYDWSKNNIVAIDNNTKYVEISTMEDAELKTALEATNAFKNDYALKFAGLSSSLITCLTGSLTEGNVYTVSFNAYEKTKGSVTLLLMGTSGTQAGQSNFTITDNGNGTKNYTTTFTAKADYNAVNLYIATECELYLADLTLQETLPAADDGLVDIQVTGTKKWSDCGIAASKFTQVAAPTTEKGFADKALQFVTPSANYTMELFNISDLTTNDSNYKSATFTVYYYVVEMTGTGLMINVDNAHFEPLEAGVGYHAVTFSVDYVVNYFSLYVDGSTTGTFVIGSVDYVINTRGQKPAETKTVSGTKAWSDCGVSVTKFTQIDAPTTEKGFADKALQFVTPQANYTMELFRMKDLTGVEGYQSATFTVYYYVTEMTGTGLYINVDNAHFEKLEAGVGYHAVTFTVNYAVDFFSLYVDGNTTGTFVIGSVDYSVTSLA